MTGAHHVVCPHCAGVNRIPTGRPAGAARCGTCKGALFDGHPAEADARMFKRQVERSGVPVLVDAWAPWCGPCRMMAPAFAEAARVLEPDVRLIKLDTESEQALAARLSIRSIPTLILFRDGREIDRISGALQARQIVDWTRQRLGVAA
ncbi:thioredoxin TrxC [Lutibaculum baratangense]|nr:thioredoxin TrxC [Lutibaculum baratangense]